jgi:carbon monoxide dehydrogenase subunit G
MEFDTSFTVPLPPADAWKVLMNIERIAPCMPGAELTQVVDPTTYKGKIGVKLGPVALSFAGQVKFEDIDEAAHKARVKASGTDSKGRGGANATADFHLEAGGEGTNVLIHTNLMLSGAVAQYGRGAGMIQDMASMMVGQFSSNLKAMLAADQAANQAANAAPVAAAAPGAPAPQPIRTAPPQAKPISGFSLFFRALRNAILRGLGRKA